MGILAALLLLTAATLALPTSKHSWTETPWDGGLAEEDGTKATTLSLPLAFNLSGAETPSLYIGGHVLNLSEYLPCQFSCQLWIRKGTQWSHYLEAARGEEVDVILYMPRYGNVDLYLISYASGTQDHWNFKLLEGYHLLRLRIEEEGRHFMMAAQKNEPGNSLILDVVSRADTATTSPLDLSLVPIGKAKVTVRSESIPKGHSGQYHQRKRAYQDLQERCRLYPVDRMSLIWAESTISSICGRKDKKPG